jgi:GDP-L-fucose synthase
MEKKTILVCGATGFIGRNLVEFFAKDPAYDVVGVYHHRPPFSHHGIRWIQADLTDAAHVERVMVGVSILIQAAAVTSGVKDVVSRPHIHVTDNAVMNSYLFRSAYEHRLNHVVFFSCSVMLQSSASALSEQDYDANAELHPRYFGAGWTKVYLEKMCEFYSRLGSTKFTAVRHSNVYGPHDKFDLDRSHVFGATITKVMTAGDTITVWGTGAEARDLLYVDDLVGMVSKIIDRQPNNFSIYNCGGGSAVTIKDLVLRIIAASGKHLFIQHDLSMPTIPTSLFLDCEKARRELEWQPRCSLDEGIRKTILWWQENIGSKVAYIRK